MTHEPAAPFGTHEEASAFEAAREFITDLMSIRSSQIDNEQAKPKPDDAFLTSLKADLKRLHQERATLQVADRAQVARACSWYGGIVRAWRARQSAPDQDLEQQLLDDMLFVERTEAQEAAMASIAARPGAVGYDAYDRLVRVRADGGLDVLETPANS